jgi:hypothetical protein
VVHGPRESVLGVLGIWRDRLSVDHGTWAWLLEGSLAGRWHARLEGIPTATGSVCSVVEIRKFKNQTGF